MNAKLLADLGLKVSYDRHPVVRQRVAEHGHHVRVDLDLGAGSCHEVETSRRCWVEWIVPHDTVPGGQTRAFGLAGLIDACCGLGQPVLVALPSV